jgi:uncharacterized protein (UPF0335 family)
MELSELDRLEQSVKRAFERLERLEGERAVLSVENRDLKNRLNALRPVPAPNRMAQDSPSVTPEQLAQIKLRISRLIDKIGEMERDL